jgi:hypothetical protein
VLIINVMTPLGFRVVCSTGYLSRTSYRHCQQLTVEVINLPEKAA